MLLNVLVPNHTLVSQGSLLKKTLTNPMYINMARSLKNVWEFYTLEYHRPELSDKQLLCDILSGLNNSYLQSEDYLGLKVHCITSSTQSSYVIKYSHNSKKQC